MGICEVKIMEKQKRTFETAIEELERIIEKMEKGDMTLDESIQSFQKGIEISKFCSEKLDEVEKKITILLENSDGDIEERDFIADNETEVGDSV